MDNTNQRPMTFGEQLVGITFNPSNDDKVARAKQLCAELADLLNDHFTAGTIDLKFKTATNDMTLQGNNVLETKSQNSQRLFSHAVGEILNAQMNVVKVLTYQF